MITYLCNDGNAEVTIEAEGPREAAEAYASDFDPQERTYWVKVRVSSAEGEPVDTVRVAIHPKEPPCGAFVHKWEVEEDGVRGSGGGVVVWERCVHCGARMRTDTWAQDPQDGTQGHTSLHYATADEAE